LPGLGPSGVPTRSRRSRPAPAARGPRDLPRVHDLRRSEPPRSRRASCVLPGGMDPRWSAGGLGGCRRRMGRLEARRWLVRADMAAGPRADGPRAHGPPGCETVWTGVGRTTGTPPRVVARMADRRRAHRRPEEAVARTDGGDGTQPEDRAETSRAPFTRGTLVHDAPARKPRRLRRARVYRGGVRGRADGRPAPGPGRRLRHQRVARTSLAVPAVPWNRFRGTADPDCESCQAAGNLTRQRPR